MKKDDDTAEARIAEAVIICLECYSETIVKGPCPWVGLRCRVCGRVLRVCERKDGFELRGEKDAP